MSLIENINKMPTAYNKVHESVYRSYCILEQVKEMLKRGDSIETIKDIIRWCEE